MQWEQWERILDYRREKAKQWSQTSWSEEQVSVKVKVVSAGENVADCEEDRLAATDCDRESCLVSRRADIG